MELWLEAEPADEWYAFCFPPPQFDFLPDMHMDLGVLHMKYMDARNLFGAICQKALCVFSFLASWQCWPLSLAVLMWWWLAWLWPLRFLALAPLWMAGLLGLLREERWNKRILWHSGVAPLNSDGFAMVAAFRDTDKMEAWMLRLLGSLGLAATDGSKLHELSGLAFRSARPVMPFEALVKLLHEQPWIQAVGGPRRCHMGHPLVGMGCTPSEDWLCMNHGGCQHPLTNKIKSCVMRYRCDTCGISICEPCVARRGNPSPSWAAIPAHLLPLSVLIILTRIEHMADGVQKALNAVMEVLAKIPFDRDPEDTARARYFYLACILASFVLAILLQLLHFVTDQSVGAALRWLLKLLLLLAVTWPLAARTSLAQSLATHLRANAEMGKYRQRRAAGGCVAHWAFFAPAAGCGARPQEPGLAAIQVCS